jgi:ATP-dependent protease ClpP protease subunit
MNQAPPRPSRVCISFSADISPKTVEALLGVMAQHANAGVPEVYLLISTPGGQVMAGLNLYNVLRAMPFRLITHNVGNVDSIGNAVFLAGEERYACPHATFMFHGVGFDFPGPFRLEEKDLRERIDAVLSDQRRIGRIIADRTQVPTNEIELLFREAQTKDAEYARANGIIHDIREVKIPSGTPIQQLVFQR